MLFIWSFVSWAGANLHGDQKTHTPLQYEVLQAIEATGLEPGMYALGTPDPNTDMDAINIEFNDKILGKPWGVLNYQEKMEKSMGMNMLRGLTSSIIVALFLSIILGNLVTPTMKTAVLVSLGIGLMAFFVEPYSYHIWFKTPGTFAHLADAIVPWVLMGGVWSLINTPA